MPDPTREEFTAAAAKVMESAPDGLSREDFYALIDKELSGSVLARANARPLSEPSTYEAGYNKSLSDTFGGAAKGFIRGLNPLNALQSAGSTIAARSQMRPEDFVLPPRDPQTPSAMDRLRSLSDPEIGGEALGNLALSGAVSQVPKIQIRGTLRAVGKGMQTYDVTKPVKPIGDLLQWAGTPRNPALPLAEPTGGVVVHGPEQFRVPYSMPPQPTPNARPVKVGPHQWSYMEKGVGGEALPEGTIANVITKRGKTWTTTVPKAPPLSLADEIKAAIMKRLGGK